MTMRNQENLLVAPDPDEINQGIQELETFANRNVLLTPDTVEEVPFHIRMGTTTKTTLKENPEDND